MALLRFKLFLGNVRSGTADSLVPPLLEVIMSNKGLQGRLLGGRKTLCLDKQHN